MSKNSLLSIFFIEDINSVVQSFLPGTQGKNWKEPDTAAKNGHIHLIQNFQKKGKYCTKKGIDWAIEFQHEDVFDYLLKQGIYWSEHALGIIALNGNTYMLRKMINNHIHPFSNRHADIAASRGNIESVYILYQNGLRCSRNGANLAAKEGYIDMLRILHKKYGIKCDEYGMYIVAKTNRTDILKYLMDEQGLYGTSIILDAAIRLKCNEVVNFLVRRGIYGTLEGWTHPLPKNFYSLNA